METLASWSLKSTGRRLEVPGVPWKYYSTPEEAAGSNVFLALCGGMYLYESPDVGFTGAVKTWKGWRGLTWGEANRAARLLEEGLSDELAVEVHGE